ncbi:MAG: exodeoxyribonuclease V subunit alpha [candidate division Zixibacteria bacterium]|nr:exodeoxyribonuclease V subunit alpha [candidate division Zixibacteria bacterium]
MNNANGILYQLKSSGDFSELDIHFARFISNLSDESRPELSLAAALISNRTQAGHICINLAAYSGKLLSGDHNDENVICPELENWIDCLRASSVVGYPGDYRPLILDKQARLYLYRYWNYERILAESILDRATREYDDIDRQLLGDGLDRLFPDTSDKETNWQKVAAFTALTKRFCVISGGPGTGKTAAVARIMTLLLEQNQAYRIALAAPTGKASARLQDSIRDMKESLDCSENIRKLITGEASTIHRLLKSIRHTPYFKYNLENPLPADVVIVDEASMVDLALMSKLAQAVAPDARLILLGDKDQLASIEAGAVLGDICGLGSESGYSPQFSDQYREITGETLISDQNTDSDPPIRDCVIQLQKSYRFGETSGIGAISRDINAGKSQEATTILTSGEFADIKWATLPSPEAMIHEIKDKIIVGYRDYLKAADPVQALEMFGRFRVLCAIREGPYGVTAMSNLIERTLRAARLIQPSAIWYDGRPVMITRNDYNLGLFNGDIGITLPAGLPRGESDGPLRVCFQSADGVLRMIPPVRLPDHETVYAMTVHKSQGSEFDRILMILPDKPSPVVTRELIYTGLTRARKSVETWCTENIFTDGVSRQIERKSGLADILWRHDEA